MFYYRPMKSQFQEYADWQRSGQLLKALGHPVRLQIVAGLLSGDCNVGRIWQCLCLPQPSISQHLRILRQEGVLVADRRGKEILYRVADDRIPEILAAMGIDLVACADVLRQQRKAMGDCES